MRRVMCACPGLALVVAFAGCANDTTGETESDGTDVTTEQADASGQTAARDAGAQPAARDAGAQPARDASAQPAVGDNSGQPDEASGASGEPDASGASGQPDASGAGAEPPEDPAGETTTPVAIDSSGDYSVIACTDDPVEPSGASYPACDGTIVCGGEAHCVPDEVVAEGTERVDYFPACSSGKCVPTAFRRGNFRFKPCAGELGEGRCVAQCVSLTLTPFSMFLQTGGFGCGREEVCAPCETSDLCTIDMCAD